MTVHLFFLLMHPVPHVYIAPCLPWPFDTAELVAELSEAGIVTIDVSPCTQFGEFASNSSAEGRARRANLRLYSLRRRV